MNKRWLILGLVITTASLAIGYRLTRDPYGLRAPARRQWASSAIGSIAASLSTSNDIIRELEGIQRNYTLGINEHEDLPTWIGSNVLAFKNGDWIVYRNKCQKEDNPVYDIFIGRGSDGIWYYSTFHFCFEMCALAMLADQQPESLSRFRYQYSLQQFDGEPDHCLSDTWDRRIRH